MDSLEALRVLKVSKKQDYADLVGEMAKELESHEAELSAVQAQISEAKKSLAQIEAQLVLKRQASGRMTERLAKDMEERQVNCAAECQAYIARTRASTEQEVKKIALQMGRDIEFAKVQYKVEAAKLQKLIEEKSGLLREVIEELAAIKRRI